MAGTEGASSHDQSSILSCGFCDAVQLPPPGPPCERTSIVCSGQLSPQGVGGMYRGLLGVLAESLQVSFNLYWCLHGNSVLHHPGDAHGKRVLDAHDHHLPNTACFLCCSQPSCPVSPPSPSLSDSAALSGHLHFNPCFGIYAI